ncbi:MAG: hypothetical protein AAFP02_02470, partial [Bacteroidota bacterium]
MQRISTALLALLLVVNLSAQNLLTYAGDQGREAFYDLHQLSDGTYLVAGFSESLTWIDPSVPTISIALPNVSNQQGSNVYPIILQLSADLQTLLRVVHLPQGSAENIRYLKFSNRPGEATGELFISGDTEDSKANNGGYFIARLNGNFVDAIPSATLYTRAVWAEGDINTNHPWDVDGQGRVSYLRGQTHAYDWAAMHRLDVNGQQMLVDNWQIHWKVAGGEYRGLIADYPGSRSELSHSGMVLKRDDRCCFRSQTQADYEMILADGNGGTKQGKWPLDAFFDSPCVPGTGPTTGPGYTGYRTGATAIYGGQSIVVDRRDGSIYLGMNIKSVLPDGNPDFEPAVVAFAEDGSLRWWSRFYNEINPSGNARNTKPDKYKDGISIDYKWDQQVVAARCHGNNVENFWEGNTIAGNASASGFQNRFTGTNGNIHISWLGKLQLQGGDLQHSTYVAEYVEGNTNYGAAHPDPLLASWPDPNAGWPDVNTTRLARNNLKVSADGSVCIIGTGRRTITTSQAHQQMPLPGSGQQGSWNEFVRVYTPDLAGLRYSSLITGAWDTNTGQGGGNTDLYGVWKTGDGILAVGQHRANNGQALGNDIPVSNTPSWGASNAQNESAILAYFKATELNNPDDGPLTNTN